MLDRRAMTTGAVSGLHELREVSAKHVKDVDDHMASGEDERSQWNRLNPNT